MITTDIQIRAIKPQAKQGKVSAGDGLYLVVSPVGGKVWRYKYRFGGKQKEITIGTYPTITLKEAGLKRNDLKRQISEGVDVAVEKKRSKLVAHAAGQNTLQVIGREWYEKHSVGKAQTTNIRAKNRLEKDVYPYLGFIDINKIEAPDILMVLRKVEDRGAVETAHRIRRLLSQIFRYAIATGRAKRDPSADLIGAIPPAVKTHYAAITEPKEIGELIRALDNYQGAFSVKCALRFIARVFQRPGEVRAAKWEDIDLDNAMWRIPSDVMKKKGRNVHLVPLSHQAVEILEEMYAISGTGDYVFPSDIYPRRMISENTLNVALRRLGYTKEQHTSHGFRAMASTNLNEQGWNRDAIEAQLSHIESNAVRGAYNHAQYMEKRKEMMQWWSDYLDSLASGADIVNINVKTN